MERKEYPIVPESYELLEEIGQGVSASVYRARCIPIDEVVAIKILDFERENCDLRNISREAQTMRTVDHPNVLEAHCSFVTDHNLWVVMPYMAGGSCLHILKAAYPDGFGEVIIATILRDVLKGLEYLHQYGYIHRDVKAGNILLDSHGAIKLGDFGVSACLFDSGDRQRSRNTFVGTPCWMAPEVMEQLNGYDFKADIWSFGITALELAHGHAPFSKYPPMKVLLMTLQNAPPGLDYERDRKFSKSFKQMIAMCLVKDPSKRPSARKLLKHCFFKQAKSNEYILQKILEGLPTLGDRIKALKIKEDDMLAQQKMPDGRKEEISQDEYKRGISAWNFNIEDLKAQASLIQDGEDAINGKDHGGSSSSLYELEQMNHCRKYDAAEKEEDDAMETKPTSLPVVEVTADNLNDEQQSQMQNMVSCNEVVVPKVVDDATSEAPNRAHRLSASNDEDLDEKVKVPVPQQRGRFKVTSENVSMEKSASSPMLQKSRSMQVISQHPAACLQPPQFDPTSSNPSGRSFLSELHTLLQTNIDQRDGILFLMKQLSSGNFAGLGAPEEKSLLELAHDKEKELLQEVTELQWRLICAQDEIQKYKAKNAQHTASAKFSSEKPPGSHQPKQKRSSDG